MSEILLNQPPELPEHLQEGWKAYTEWAEAMARAGEPLPPGGCFILNRNTIVKGCLARLHVSLASALEMDLQCIKIDLEHDEITGAVRPKIDVIPPDGWMQKVFFAGNKKPPEGQRIDDFANTYIQGMIERFYHSFVADVKTRMDALKRCSRPDLEPDGIEDILEGKKEDIPEG